MPSLLVTGGAGFIGSHIVDAAVAEGWQVRILDSYRDDVHPTQVEQDDRADATVIRADIRDPDAVDDALRGVDVVCHQAAKVGLGKDFADTPDYVSSNDLGTAVLLAGAARAGVARLVLASSMVVYGEGRYRDSEGVVPAPPRAVADLEAGRFEPVSPRTGDVLSPEWIDEDAPLDPRNVYAATKVAQEALVRSWARATGGTAALLRYHNVYGPRMPSGTPYAGVASLFRSQLERGEAPTVFEDGGQRRDFIHVTDVARANLAAVAWTDAVTSGEARAFNVASGVVHTVGDFAAALSREFGGPEPIVTGDFRLGDVRHITAAADRARRELEWSATVDFESGVQAFAHDPVRSQAESPG
jgi:dTDP-L-rhamnose 4-epimerase